MSKKKKLTEEEQAKALELLEEIGNSDIDSLQEKLSLEDITLVRKYISYRIKSLGMAKKIYFANDELINYEKCREEIIRLKKCHKMLGKLANDFINEVQPLEKSKVNNNDKKKYAISNILMLDFYLSSFDEELFNTYLKSKDYFERMQCLIKLREMYIKATYNLYRKKKIIIEKNYKIIAFENDLDGGLKKNKKEFTYLLNLDSYSNLRKEIALVKEKYNKCKRFLEEIERLIKLEEKEYSCSIPKKFLEIDDTDYKELIEDKFIEYKEFISRLENIRDGKYIRKYGLGLENFIPKELLVLFGKLEKLNDDVLEEISILGVDVLKNKLRNLKKGLNPYDDVERKFLKTLIKMFEDLAPKRVEFEEADTSVYYDIADSLCHNDNNYSYIEKLIKENEHIRDARKNNCHIIISLLDSFILNYKLKLVNQGFTFIEPNFYKEIIKAFYKNGVRLTEEEVEIINKRLDEFLEYVNKKKYVSSGLVNKDVEELRNIGGEVVKSDIDRDKLKQEVSLLDFELDSVIRNYMRKYPMYKDGFNSRTFMIKGIDNCCFSINYENYQDIVFGVHFLDTSKIVSEDSEIVKGALEGKKIIPKMKKGLNPVMSFTYHFLNYKDMSDLRFGPGVVYVDKEYDENDIDSYREKEDLKNMYIFLNNLVADRNIYTVDGIKEVVFGNIKEELKKKFRDCKVPFIYEKTPEDVDDIIRLNHNAICDKLSKIPKKEAHRIFEIIDEELDKYYVPRNDDSADISLDTSDFLGYYLMSVLNKLQSGKYDIDKESEKLKIYLEKLNNRRAYLPVNIAKSNENKIKRMVRNYKKAM